MNPPMAFSRVDLPHPEGPRSMVRSPRRTRTVTPRVAVTTDTGVLYWRVTSTISKIGEMLVSGTDFTGKPGERAALRSGQAIAVLPSRGFQGRRPWALQYPRQARHRFIGPSPRLGRWSEPVSFGARPTARLPC